jgi:hypothetical protein
VKTKREERAEAAGSRPPLSGVAITMDDFAQMRVNFFFFYWGSYTGHIRITVSFKESTLIDGSCLFIVGVEGHPLSLFFIYLLLS